MPAGGAAVLVGGATAEEPYKVPEDNPLVGDSSARPEVWAYGFRNPWRFSFDPSGEFIWEGDVGQNSYEEINIVRPGHNYGWSVMEGTHCFPPETASCDQEGKDLPLVEYPTYQNGCAVPAMEAGDRMVVRFDVTMDVQPGQYSFGLGAGEPTDENMNAGVAHDRIDELGPIVVGLERDGMRPFYGLARLPMRVSHIAIPGDQNA